MILTPSAGLVEDVLYLLLGAEPDGQKVVFLAVGEGLEGEDKNRCCIPAAGTEGAISPPCSQGCCCTAGSTRSPLGWACTGPVSGR